MDKIKIDGRLNLLLESFMRPGWYSVEFGIQTPTELVWRPDAKDYVPVTTDDHCNLVIKDGFILNNEDIPDVLEILDDAGITEALPTFEGKEELATYTLNEGQWVKTIAPEEGRFYSSFYSVS